MNSVSAFQKIKSIAIYGYVFFYSLFMSLFLNSSPFNPAYFGDSAVFVYIAKVIIGGGMPYKDTFDHKGPFIYLIDALGLLISEKTGIWLLELITIFIIFYYAYEITRLLHCNHFFSCLILAIGVFVLMCYLQGGNLTEEYACAFITVSFYYFLKFFMVGEIVLHQLVICGASFAAVCLLRANMVALWGVIFVGIIVEWKKQGKNFDIVQIAKWFVVGVLILTIPILIWLLTNDVFSAFIDDYFLFNMKYSSDQNMASFYNMGAAFKYFVLNPLVLVSIVSLLYFCIRQNKDEDWFCLSALFLSIIMSCISGRKSAHYGMIFYPFIVYSFARFFSVFIKSTFNSIGGQCIKSILLLAYFFTLTYYLLIPWKSLLNKDLEETRKIAEIVQSVTTVSDKISVCGNDNNIYLLSNRKSASYYSYQFPIANIDFKIWQAYFDDIKNLTAKVIIVVPGIYKAFPYNQIMEVLYEHYVLVGQVGGTDIYLLK